MKNQLITMVCVLVTIIATCQSAGAEKSVVNKNHYLSYVSSSKHRLTFCNGDKMASAAYRKTITQIHVTKISTQHLSKQQQLNKTAELVGKLMGGVDLTQGYHGKYVLLKGSTALIKPTDGWSGVSIYLCAYQPLLEVNLLRYPFVKKVVWQ